MARVEIKGIEEARETFALLPLQLVEPKEQKKYRLG